MTSKTRVAIKVSVFFLYTSAHASSITRALRGPWPQRGVEFVARECCEHSFASENVADCHQESDLGAPNNGLKHTTDSELECANWMNTAVKGPGSNNFCRRTDTATYSSITQSWCFPLNGVSTPTVCGVSLRAAAERNFGDEADDLTLKVKAQDCSCIDQFSGSTLTTRDTSVTSLTELFGKNLSETAASRGPECRSCTSDGDD